jgi:hypothetical protein
MSRSARAPHIVGGFGILFGLFGSAAGYAGTAPTLSGAYTAIYNQYCQPDIRVVYDEGATALAAVDAAMSYYGNLRNVATKIDFDPGTMTAQLSGAGSEGSIIAMTDKNNNYTWGRAIRNAAYRKSEPYSNTSSTLTLNGVPLQAVYGTQVNGVAQSVAAMGLDKKGCSVSIYAVR